MLPVIGGLSLLAAIPNVEASTNYTLAEVNTHNTLTSCWVVNNDKVYDLTSYLNAHPVGAVIAKNLCGIKLNIPFSTGNLEANTLNIGLIGDLATTTDTISPAAPTNLIAKIKSYNKVKLSWAKAIDNIAVSGYKIFRNNILIANTHELVFNDNSVTASTTYQYAVVAYDKAGNNSATSTIVSITTPVVNPKYTKNNKHEKENQKNNSHKTVNKFLKDLRNDLRQDND